MNQLQRAMHNIGADLEDMEFAQAAGRQAVQAAIAHDDDADAVRAEREQAEVQRQRDLDAALADAIEIVARQRARLGRRVCNRLDGELVRTVFETLRRVQAETSEPGFPQ
jgi:hypothetical protein